MKVKTIAISLFIILLFGQTTYAAIEIVPSKNGQGTDAIVNTTVSNSYSLCRNMTYAGESLSGATVIPHLTTNKDWGAVSYLANSVYGTESKGQNTGIELVLDKDGNLAEEENGVKYYSTNGNATGVMNWGSNPLKVMLTQTSSLASFYDKDTNSDLTELIKAKNENSPFIEIIDVTNLKNTLGMAIGETAGLYESIYRTGTYVDYPVSVRTGLFGLFLGSYFVENSNYEASGRASGKVTFRPVIWNK